MACRFFQFERISEMNASSMTVIGSGTTKTFSVWMTIKVEQVRLTVDRAFVPTSDVITRRQELRPMQSRTTKQSIRVPKDPDRLSTRGQAQWELQAYVQAHRETNAIKLRIRSRVR